MDEPREYREHERAEERRPESRDGKSGHDERHPPEKERVEHERKEAERDDGDRQRENGEDRLDYHRDDGPCECGEEYGEPAARYGDARHDVDRENNRRNRAKISKYQLHV